MDFEDWPSKESVPVNGLEYQHNHSINDAGTVVEMAHEFPVSLLQAGFGSVHMEVQAIDYAGNDIYVERELKGAFGQLLDALGEMWNAIWNVLVSVAKAMMSGVNVFLQWLMNLVNETINTLLGPLISAYENWQNALINTIKAGWNEYNATGSIKASTLESFNQLIGGTFFWILVGISTGLLALSLTLNALTFGATSIISMVIAPVVTLAILAVFSITQEKKISLDLSGVALSVDSIWNFVVDTLGGKSSKFTTYVKTSIKKVLEIAALWFKNCAVVIEGLSLGALDFTGMMRETLAFVFGALGVSLAAIGAATGNLIISALGFGFGAAGFVLSFTALVSSIIAHELALHSIISLALSGSGLALALYTASLHERGE